MKNSVQIDPDNSSANISLLNVGESIQFSAVTFSTDSLPARAKVSVRGKGVVGEADAYQSPFVRAYAVVSTVVWVLFIILVLFSIVSVMYQKLVHAIAARLKVDPGKPSETTKGQE